MGWRRDHFRCCGEVKGDVQLCVTSRERLQLKTCLSALLPKIRHMGELVLNLVVNLVFYKKGVVFYKKLPFLIKIADFVNISI